jgi:addiction module RelB/DinJ family antitoxin
MTRSAVLQARVRPDLKYASERVLRNIGLTMTAALELFLRRLILDQRLPFEIAALDDATLANIVSSWQASRKDLVELGPARTTQRRKRQKRK